MARSQEPPDLPREFPGLEPDEDLLPDPLQPGPRGEEPDQIDRPEPAPRRPGGPAFELPGMPRTASLVTDSVITRPLSERMASAPPDEAIGIIVELRTDSGLEPAHALAQLTTMLTMIAPRAPVWNTRAYLMSALTADEIRRLAEVDSRGAAPSGSSRHDQRSAPRRFIHRIWPNFEVRAAVHRTVMTTKAEAAIRAFDATGEGIVWAVLDTGVDAKHPHFATHDTFDLPGNLAHRSFVPGSSDTDALTDVNGHGTHVTGIIAGGRTATAKRPIVAATWYRTAGGAAGVERVTLDRISGMAPRTKILSCKVLRDDRTGDVAALLAALEHIQDLNNGGRELNVHGVNLSLGYPFDPSWFATGLSPVCREVDRLVASGVCVVVAAGNTGYGAARDTAGREMRLGFGMTINDPGNAARGITVGSTSVNPYSSGVSYFSSKGPTGDGRLKPDLVAPGERVVSAGAGYLLEKARAHVADAAYVEDSGTSMSAPHVSGVAAGFLSVHREFIGKPDDLKRILMDTASDLGRERAFQGRGLVDAMRAIQYV
jgi:serine protease AprX